MAITECHTAKHTRQSSFRAAAAAAQELNANHRPNRKRFVCSIRVASAITDAYDRDSYTHLKRPKSHDIAMAARLLDTIDNIPHTVCGHVFMSFLVSSHFNRIHTKQCAFNGILFYSRISASFRCMYCSNAGLYIYGCDAAWCPYCVRCTYTGDWFN